MLTDTECFIVSIASGSNPVPYITEQNLNASRILTLKLHCATVSNSAGHVLNAIWTWWVPDNEAHLQDLMTHLLIASYYARSHQWCLPCVYADQVTRILSVCIIQKIRSYRMKTFQKEVPRTWNIYHWQAHQLTCSVLSLSRDWNPPWNYTSNQIDEGTFFVGRET